MKDIYIVFSELVGSLEERHAEMEELLNDSWCEEDDDLLLLEELNKVNPRNGLFVGRVFMFTMQAFEIEEEEVLLDTLHKIFQNMHYQNIIHPQPSSTSRFACKNIVTYKII